MGRRKAKTAIITFILTLLIVGAIAGFVCWKLVTDKQTEIDTLVKQKADGQVYAFARDLKANTVITPADITVIDIKSVAKTSGMYLVSNGNYTDDNGEFHGNTSWVDSKQVSHDYAIHYTAVTDKYGVENKSFLDVLVDEDIIGRMVKSNVSKNTPILDSVMYAKDEDKPSKDIRVQEFNFIQIPSSVEIGDYIDVRIAFATGEDYRVLGGKRIENSKMRSDDGMGNQTIVVNLSEADIMTMASAVVEAYMQDGVKIYANKYVDPANQLFKETIVDYIEQYKKGVELALLEKDFNKIVESLSKMTEEERAAIESESPEGYARTFAYDGTTVTVTTSYTNEAGEPVTEQKSLTFDAYKEMPSGDRNALGIKFDATKEEDLKDEDIYKFAGMRMEHVKAIREALKDEQKNINTINYYKAFRLKTKIDVATTYPVKKEVLAAIEKNPDVTSTIFAAYSKMVNESTRYDKLLQLEKEYANAPEQKDMYGGSEVKTKSEILVEIKDLLDKRADNVKENVQAEQTQQRKDRIEYLNTLLGTSLSSEEE